MSDIKRIETVIAIQGNAIKEETLNTPQDGYVLTWDGYINKWEAKPLPIIDIGGLLSQKRIQYWSGGHSFAFGNPNETGTLQGAAGFLNCNLYIGGSGFFIDNIKEGVPQNPNNLLSSTPRCASDINYLSFGESLGSWDFSDYCGLIWRGNSTDLGGFKHLTRFGIDQLSSATSPTTLSTFIGLHDGYSYLNFEANMPQIVDFTTQTTLNTIGIGWTQDISSGITGNWQVISSTAGNSPTLINSGLPITIGDVIELVLVAEPNDTQITYQIKNISQNIIVNGIISSNLPSNTVFLAWQATITALDNFPTTGIFSTIRYYMESNY